MPGALIERGERVTLRTVEREDAAFVQRGFTDPEVRYPLGNLSHRNLTQVEAFFEEFVEDDGSVNFLVCLDDEDAARGQPAEGSVTPVGEVSASDVDWRRPTLGYWLAPEYHGEGYGREAVSLAVDYLFRTFDVPAVGAHVYDFNGASRTLLESLGFAREGRQRKVRFVDGAYRDALLYGVLREEWSGADE